MDRESPKRVNLHNVVIPQPLLFYLNMLHQYVHERGTHTQFGLASRLRIGDRSTNAHFLHRKCVGVETRIRNEHSNNSMREVN